MPKPIQIDFVSDVVCPWCVIGLRELETALARLIDVVEPDIHLPVDRLGLPPAEIDRIGFGGADRLKGHHRRQHGQAAKNRQTDGEEHATVQAAEELEFHDFFLG